jgi:hypothetical protein
MVVRCEDKCQGFTIGMIVDRRQTFGTLFGMRKPAKAKSELDCVDAGVRAGEAGIGDVHEANLSAPIIFALQEVRADGATGGEIDVRGARWDLVIREQGAAADVNVRCYVVVLDEIPFQSKGI